MDNDRYFVNNLPIYKGGSLLNMTSDKLASHQRESLNKSALQMLDRLEQGIPTEIDWKDVSVYTGTSGYTLLYLHLFSLTNNDKYLQKACSITEKSLKVLKGRRHTFLCGDPGPLALGAIVYDKLKMTSEAELCVSKLIKLKKEVLELESDMPDELLYGRVGYLYALLLVDQRVESQTIEPDLIQSVISIILESGQLLSARLKVEVPLSYEWHRKNYLGAAHGVCGILSLLLQAKDKLSSSELNDIVKPTIDDLMRYLFPSGNLASSAGSSSDRLVHWCHGAPAAVLLFSLAFRVFSLKMYLDVACKAAEVVWSRGLLKKGYGLCHGTAGNGYALLFLYQVTRQDKYLHMAIQFARWCQDYEKHGCRTPDRPLSLFEGLAGTIYFLTDIQTPDKAKFPAFIL